MESLYYEIELSFCACRNGICGFHVEKSELERLSQEFGEGLTNLPTRSIHWPDRDLI